MGSRKERTPRKSGILRQEKSKWLVVCEGTKTEPNYLKGVIEFMNTKIPQDMQLDVTITGMGMNTTSLVDKAMELQNLVDRKKREVLIPYKYTIVVFDKDSFSDNDFNKAIQMCEKEGYIACWSNQAVEYFFLLHFFYCDSGIDRKDYKQKIDEQFASHGCSQKYQKNLLKIFHIFYQYGGFIRGNQTSKENS